MSAMLGLMLGTQALVVGVEDEPTGGTRVYIDARYLNRYCVIDDHEAEAMVRRQWANAHQHLTIPRPPDDCIYVAEGQGLVPALTTPQQDEAA